MWYSDLVVHVVQFLFTGFDQHIVVAQLAVVDTPLSTLNRSLSSSVSSVFGVLMPQAECSVGTGRPASPDTSLTGLMVNPYPWV